MFHWTRVQINPGGEGAYMADLSERIEQAAAAPSGVVMPDGTEVREHNLKDLIAADNHLAKKEAASQPVVGLRLVRLVHRGKYG